MTNNKKTDLDYALMKIFERADFNILNIKKQLVNFKEHTVADYDKVLREVFDKNKNLSDMELEELKNKLYNEKKPGNKQ